MMGEAEISDNSTPVYYSSNRGGTKLELNGFVYNKDRTVKYLVEFSPFSTKLDHLRQNCYSTK